MVGGGFALIALAINLLDAGWGKGGWFEALINKTKPDVRPDDENWANSWD